VLTIFTSAKAFRDQAEVHQNNAIQSWLHLFPDVEILIFGNEYGVDEITRRYGLRNIPQVERTELGTPILSGMFSEAQRLARHELVAYVNADIILMEDFERAVRRVSRWRSQFVMVSHRWDIDLDEPLGFSADWRSQLRRRVARTAKLSDSSALDCFVFRRGVIRDMPPFAIGRPAWDNWLIKHLLASNIPIVDATGDYIAVHPNHGYGHVPKASGQVWEGPEADRNRALARATDRNFRPDLYTVKSATHILRRGLVLPAWTPRHLSWRLHTVAQLGDSGFWRITRLARRLLSPLVLLRQAREHAGAWTRGLRKILKTAGHVDRRN
jgi:hypothetical protein